MASISGRNTVKYSNDFRVGGRLDDLDRLQTSFKPYHDDVEECSEAEDDSRPPSAFHGGFRDESETPSRMQSHHPPPPGDVIVHVVPEASKSRWSHIEDLDSFFKRVYTFHRKHGFKVMMVEECLGLVQFLFTVVLSVFLFECVDYDILFQRGEYTGMRPSFKDVVDGQCVAHFSLTTWTLLGLALVFWSTRAVRTFYHFFQYWDIKSFYNVALKIEDSELESFTWHEVQKRLIAAQEEYLMCIHKHRLTELDIYHRILRFTNYMVAMTNKDLLPCKLDMPFVGEKIFLSQGLKYNLEFLFFRGPWAPFNQFHLKEDFKKALKKRELTEYLQSKIALLALVNLCFAPIIFFWQLLYSFYKYTEMFKREPGTLGVRKWSKYSRIYLRHFNELDHEFRSRLNRAYAPANRYMELFVSPMGVVIAKHLRYMAGSVFAVFIVLTTWDIDVAEVDHILFVMTILGVICLGCSAYVPDENMVFCPERTLTNVMAHIHYFPESWRGMAHTSKVMAELGDLFPYTFSYLLDELFSPLLTPFVLYFTLRPKAGQIVDFFRNFTVDVTGVGDVCSFAEMDVRRHGNPKWQPRKAEPAAAASHVQKNDFEEEDEEYHEDNIPLTSRGGVPAIQEQANDGKTELSLIHFTLTNPEWKPPSQSAGFLNALRDQATKDAEQLATVPEEAAADNALYNSLTGLETAGGVYTSLAKDMMQSANTARITTATSAILDDPLSAVNNPEVGGGSPSRLTPESAAKHQNEKSLMESVHQGFVNSSSAVSSHYFPSMAATGGGLPFSANSPTGAGGSSSIFSNSRMATLAPPPNLRKDLRRLGLLEYTEAEVSFSALYLHELHHKAAFSSSSSATSSQQQQHHSNFPQSSTSSIWKRHNTGQQPTTDFMAASLNEVDEEPLVDTSASKSVSG